MAISPMMQQYMRIKEENKDCILFFRLGDFYEMFFDDAVLVSRELELTLTGKDCGLSERAPMCGVPYHAADNYITQLIEKGYKVAICEQMTDPAEAKGLVEREVIRIVTPGTVIEGNLLSEREPHYLVSLCLKGDNAGAAFCDVSTGEFCAYRILGIKQRLSDELARVSPREILVNDAAKLTTIGARILPVVTEGAPESFEYAPALEQLKAHFGASGVSALDVKEHLPIQAAGALMKYLNDTQKNALGHILTLKKFEPKQYMTIDRVASSNLELTDSGLFKNRKGSLLHTLDRTLTAMGSRMLRSWMERPLQDVSAIEERLDAVALFTTDLMGAQALREQLKDVYDIERLLSKIAYDSINARDCLALARSLKTVPFIKQAMGDMDAVALRKVNALLVSQDGLTDLLDSAISPDAPLSIKEGGLIRLGFDEQLDKFRSAARDGKGWIADLERQEREQTGIKNLKIGFNRVFGYYIEITKSAYDMVPYRYARKQTLANCERFVTQELKDIEKTVLGADDQAMRLEYELFTGVRQTLKEKLPVLQSIAEGIKTLDALLSLAQVALENDYVRPRINTEGRIDIKDGRHPVVEQSLGHDQFVPNDTSITDQSRVMIITGPNMAGKSTYMRQVALIVLMAHMGSFVPARTAEIPITDRIFTRIGASDDLYGGQSTFMVEMTELATILKYATDHSLLILDEVGRGTSTFDGLSIAWAAVEHIAGKTRARTLFATHYHELSELEGHLDGVSNYRITAKEQGEDVIFLRKIVPGGADRSFGVAVASLAGLPSTLISRARQIMARLEVNGELSGSIGQSILDKRKNSGNKQVGLADFGAMELVEELRAIDVMSLSPIDALNRLYTLNEKARRI
ncbi:MAG: DNA mismatch repair protein MutS [Clostridia bacterium]